jgi:hypothetical protein
MNHKIYNYIFLILALILILNLFNNTFKIGINNTENFTPKIREMYRPYVRNTRIATNSLYNKYNNNISNIFRKIGLI